MNLRITPEVYASLPSALKEELRRSVPVRTVVLGRDAEDAERRLRALGHPELAERLTKALDAPVEALTAGE